VSAHAARQILGAIKFRYDVVLVDIGAVVTEGNAVGAEMADEVLIVTTPDVPALRAANRLMALWERLAVRKPESVRVVVNRVNKQLEVQPDLIRKVVNASLVKTVMPAAFKDLEPAVNTGVPDRLNDGVLHGAFVKLGQEVGVIPRRRGRRKLALRSSSEESGSLAVETMGMTFFILFLALAAWQMVLAGYTYVLAGHAAREGARELAVGADAEAAALSDLPGSWKDAADVSEGADWVEVEIAMPMVLPGVDGPIHIAVKAGTVVESAPAFDQRSPP
jgi:pilus assembly protein CpaE